MILHQNEYELAVNGFAGDELAVVEADAVVEYQRDVLRHQLACVAVDTAFQFRFDVAEDIVQLLAFTLRYVQGLVDRIAEEGVGRHLYSLHQRRREDEHHALVALFECAQLDVVVGGKEKQRTVIIVVLVAPVVHGAAASILINHAVETERIAGVSKRTAIIEVVKVDDLDERMAHIVAS